MMCNKLTNCWAQVNYLTDEQHRIVVRAVESFVSTEINSPKWKNLAY
jgi:hypothetical protein